MTLMRSVLSSSTHPIFDTRVTPTKLQVDGLDEVFGTHTLRFSASVSPSEELDAIHLLQTMNIEGRREVPEAPRLGLSRPIGQLYIGTARATCYANRYKHCWKACVLFALRGGLCSGEPSRAGSRPEGRALARHQAESLGCASKREPAGGGLVARPLGSNGRLHPGAPLPADNYRLDAQSGIEDHEVRLFARLDRAHLIV
jgi:hypothetical protein